MNSAESPVGEDRFAFPTRILPSSERLRGTATRRRQFTERTRGTTRPRIRSQRLRSRRSRALPIPAHLPTPFSPVIHNRVSTSTTGSELPLPAAAVSFTKNPPSSRTPGSRPSRVSSMTLRSSKTVIRRISPSDAHRSIVRRSRLPVAGGLSQAGPGLPPPITRVISAGTAPESASALSRDSRILHASVIRNVVGQVLTRLSTSVSSVASAVLVGQTPCAASKMPVSSIPTLPCVS